MSKKMLSMLCGLALCAMQPALAQTKPAEAPAVYDAELAKSLGGDDRGMRRYVLVILKTGPNRMPDGPERTKMFQGHFANIQKLANEKVLALAGPLDGKEGRRGIFVLATPDIEQAKVHVAGDPVIVQGEMVAEYHQFYGSAGLMAVNEIHNKIQKKPAN